jgi:ketosteroid isomerase-like protein
MAEQTGFHAALLAFADDSLIKPEEGMLPIFGKKSLEDKWAGEPGTKGLTWEPRKAEASASGDLGYTFGDWKLVRPDTVYFGNYITVWKKHPDGSWKWMLDGGNNTPAPD